MLLSLAGRNFFTFREFYVEFSSGMNAITGESGAGKTIFLKALWTAIGFPPPWSGEESGNIEANFSVEDSILKRIGELGIEIGDGNQLLVSVNFTGQRTIYRLNGRMVPRQMIQMLFKDLIEIHSQHSSVALLDSNRHYQILDHALQGERSLEEYRELYEKYSSIKRELDSLVVDPSQIEREKDFLTFEIKEIEQAELKTDEDGLLETRYRKYKNGKFLVQTFRELMDRLKDGDESVYNSLNDILSLITKVESFGYSRWLSHVQLALEELEGLYNLVSEESNGLDIDEEEFRAIEARISLIQGLKRKYGRTVSDILQSCDEFKNKLKSLQELQKREEKLRKEESIYLQKLREVGRVLDGVREKRAIEMARDIRIHLEDLKMKGAELEFRLFQEEEPKFYGTSRVSIMVKTNPGMEFMEIGSVASGGELSRCLLALESTLKDQLEIRTIVFDEVDSGVGQRLGQVVAEKLLEISSKVQSIVITHLPQIASRAERHFAVRKEQFELDTISTIEELSGEKRERELVEMSGLRGEAWKGKNL